MSCSCFCSRAPPNCCGDVTVKCDDVDNDNDDDDDDGGVRFCNLLIITHTRRERDQPY